MGKPLGITLFVFISVLLGISKLPSDLNWTHIFGAGLLGGIGFTMSIFIANLAFTGETELINSPKIAMFIASLTAGAFGFLWLKFFGADTHSEIHDQIKFWIDKKYSIYKHFSTPPVRRRASNVRVQLLCAQLHLQMSAPVQLFPAGCCFCQQSAVVVQAVRSQPAFASLLLTGIVIFQIKRQSEYLSGA